MSADIQKLADATSKVLETVPEIYNDLAQPAAKQTGTLIARIPRAINAALSGIDAWIAKREYALEGTKKLLEIKLQNVDPEKIVPPEPYVAVPAIQAISYCMDSDELREMYANLLAKAMNADYKNTVHPSFVEVIKQLSPVDAENLLLFKNNDYKGLPIAEYRFAFKNGTFSTYITNVFLSNPKRNDIHSQAISLSSLQRVGLIDLLYGKTLSDHSVYDAFKETDEYKAYLGKVNDNFTGVQIQNGCATATPLARLFMEICLQ